MLFFPILIFDTYFLLLTLTITLDNVNLHSQCARFLSATAQQIHSACLMLSWEPYLLGSRENCCTATLTSIHAGQNIYNYVHTYPYVEIIERQPASKQQHALYPQNSGLLSNNSSANFLDHRSQMYLYYDNNTTCQYALFRNKRFMLNLMLQRNPSKFAIFLS